MKTEWRKEEYAVCCTGNGRNELAWFKTDISKVEEVRKDPRTKNAEKKKIYTCNIKMFGKEEVKGSIFSSKRLNFNEDVAYEKSTVLMLQN
jgi:hypothetical protein